MRLSTSTYLILLILLASCSANKFLPENEKYFEGHNIVYQGEKSHLPKDLEYTLAEDLKPETTRRILLSRPGAWIYGVMGTPKKDKGIKHWIKHSLGNKPFYLSQLNIEQNESILRSKLKNNGYFNATVSAVIDSTKHKANAIYTVELRTPYLLDSVKVCSDQIDICNKIKSHQRKDPVLKYGDLFRTSNLIAERKSITREFRNEGYYFFSPDFLYFQADSNDGDNKVRLELALKDNLIQGTLKPYTLASAQFNLAANSFENTTILGDSLRVLVDTTQLYIKPIKLEPFIAFIPGKLYSKADEELTLKQLNKLEVFEFVNVQYEVDSSDANYNLRAILMATPRKQHSLRTEFNLSTTSTNFTGPGLQFEYYNRNLFKGAEKLRLTATGRYETQLTGSRKGLDSYEIDVQASLLIPRVSGPLKKRSTSGNVPKTKYRLQFKLYNQPDYYAQASSSASFGYEWLKGKETHNDLRLINLDYVRLLQSSDQLEELFDDNILSRESFEDQVILGSNYSIAHAPKAKPGRRVHYFIGASAEIAGNLLYGVSNWTNAAQDSGQYTLANVPFAQYARLQFDFRTYIKWAKYMQFVMRQNIGVGIPYGNSEALPFSKQFFVGGASSLRGFQPRSIGPGSYINNQYGTDSYFDQSGDILIEFNFENRIDLGNYFEFAFFMDVGNVWLKNTSTERPGGEFEWKNFVSEMAVSGGIGVRLDFDFVLLRLDLAVPMRIPYLPEGERWTVDKISIAKSWRKDNLLWNIAIGYPF